MFKNASGKIQNRKKFLTLKVERILKFYTKDFSLFKAENRKVSIYQLLITYLRIKEI